MRRRQDAVDESWLAFVAWVAGFEAIDFGCAPDEHDECGEGEEDAGAADADLDAFAGIDVDAARVDAGGEDACEDWAEGHRTEDGDVDDGHDAASHGVGDEHLDGGEGGVEGPEPEEATEEDGDAADD